MSKKKTKRKTHTVKDGEDDESRVFDNQPDPNEPTETIVHVSDESKDPLSKLLNTIVDNKADKSTFDVKEFTGVYKNIIESLVDTQDDKLNKLTDLKENTITSLATLQTVADYYEFKSINSFLRSYYKLRISKDRKGREELSDVGKLLNQLITFDMAANSQNPYMATSMMNQQQPQIQSNPEIPKKRRRFGIF